MTRKGFTLIELLVVVAIIAVLIALLLPALSSARNQAQLVVCKTKMQGIGQSVYAYAADNNDWVPPYTAELYFLYYKASDSVQRGYNADGWGAHGLLYKWKYIIDPKTFYCPSNIKPPRNDIYFEIGTKMWNRMWNGQLYYITSNYEYIGGLYTHDLFDARSKITDNSGRAIMTEFGVFQGGHYYPHNSDAVNILYLGGDVITVPASRFFDVPLYWWHLLDRQAKD
jgi:prepilin-type N-terminal cleavage/methylation domain-containing protein